MAKKKNRKQSELIIETLKDLFLENILTNKKFLPFAQSVKILQKTQLTEIEDEALLKLFSEDFFHKKYLEYLELIDNLMIEDPLKPLKKKMMSIILELLLKKPEREEKILEMLVNKLGDPDSDIANFAIKLLKTLQNVNFLLI